MQQINETDLLQLRDILSFAISVTAGLALKLAYEWQAQGRLGWKYVVSNVIISFSGCYLLHYFIVNGDILNSYYQPVIGAASFMSVSVTEAIYDMRKKIAKKIIEKYMKDN